MLACLMYLKDVVTGVVVKLDIVHKGKRGNAWWTSKLKESIQGRGCKVTKECGWENQIEEKLAQVLELESESWPVKVKCEWMKF